MDLSELEQANPKVEPVEAEFEEGLDPEEELLKDFQAANKLLDSVKVLLDYVSDQTLVKTLSKREREIMARMSENIRQHLVEAEANWSNQEFE